VATVREDARVLLVGIGGLGCPAAIALARANVGTIGICDDDVVEETNLHRQILFSVDSIEKNKVAAAAEALNGLAPTVRIERHDTRLLPDNAMDLVRRYDIVVEGSDNFATKFLAADACAIARVPIVHAAAVRWHGTVLAVGREGKPCYRCLFEDLPEGEAPNCADAGVVGPMVGVVAALQADLVLAMIDGLDVNGTLVTFDGKLDALRRRVVGARPGCVLCDRRSISHLEAERYAPVATTDQEREGGS
jgi:molybdopterin/thiamine biosynthesis adenylyltransferase